MDKIKIKDNAIIGELKRQFAEFINNSKSIDISSKVKLLNELGYNSDDDRFNAAEFLEGATEYSIKIWRDENLKLAELWKGVAIENAKINNTPYDVADETLKRFKSEFSI